jgi:hypothetical protein
MKKVNHCMVPALFKPLLAPHKMNVSITADKQDITAGHLCSLQSEKDSFILNSFHEKTMKS